MFGLTLHHFPDIISKTCVFAYFWLPKAGDLNQLQFCIFLLICTQWALEQLWTTLSLTFEKATGVEENASTRPRSSVFLDDDRIAGGRTAGTAGRGWELARSRCRDWQRSDDRQASLGLAMSMSASFAAAAAGTAVEMEGWRALRTWICRRVEALKQSTETSHLYMHTITHTHAHLMHSG